MSWTKHRYTNGEVTIIWQPTLCIHCGNCARGLPSVFKPRERPWITAEGASTREIIAQVSDCPSGALSYEMTSDDKSSINTASETQPGSGSAI